MYRVHFKIRYDSIVLPVILSHYSASFEAIKGSLAGVPGSFWIEDAEEQPFNWPHLVKE